MRDLILSITRALVADCQAGTRKCSLGMLALCDEHRAVKAQMLLDPGWMSRMLALRRERDRLWGEEWSG